jgi:oligopeptide/dipeptide ABC transporter ATP-binding protein
VVSAFTDRVMIMYLGRTMEDGRADEVFEAPRHPYTEALLASIPPLDRDEARLRAIEGTVPSAFDVPPGCPFEPRCGHARPPCATGLPPLVDFGGHRAACIRNTGYEFRS